ncbi:restriction endonuclease subunit S [Candidatus Halobeggiatoa sp. HSG11]|nr:restriction endonuclease subunit S [Candidatus Halobeggiatoa sp. HSG11]
MSEWKKVKIGDISEYKKEFIVIDDDIEYKRCRVQLHQRGIVLRDKINGSAIKTKKQRLCKSGDFIVAEMDAKFGGYGIIPDNLHDAIVSSHYYLFKLEKTKISIDYMNALLETNIIQSQIKARGTTNYSSIRPKNVLNYEIPLPNMNTQLKIVHLFNQHKKTHISLSSEITNQQTLLKKLHQAILQEAIQGKLTVDWRKKNPDVEPASELLKRIQAEKETLIAEKKIKKQKPLPPIKAEEIPFGLPKGWVWCRLGELVESYQNGISKRGGGNGVDIVVLRLADIKNYSIYFDNTRSLTLDTKELDKFKIEDDDILVTRVNGSVDIVGNFNYCNNISLKNITYCDHLIRMRVFFKEIIASYLFFVEKTFLIREQVKSKFKTTAGQKTINQGHLSNFFIPLPPLPEQKAIVAKVEKLLAHCDQLEQQINQSQTNSQQLMQAVLREAFE